MRFARTWLVTLAGAGMLVLPSQAAGQACIGVPIPNGSFGIAGHYQTTDGATGFGAALTANLAGPLSLQGRYTRFDLDGIDDDANAFGGTIAFEVPNLAFSVCPFAGVDYTKLSATDPEFEIDMEITETVIPIGIGLGYTFPASPTLGLTIYGMPQFMHIRSKFSVPVFDDESFKDEANEFGADVGFRLSTRSFFGGAGVMFTTLEESDPVFSIVVGVAVGGAR